MGTIEKVFMDKYICRNCGYGTTSKTSVEQSKYKTDLGQCPNCLGTMTAVGVNKSIAGRGDRRRSNFNTSALQKTVGFVVNRIGLKREEIVNRGRDADYEFGVATEAVIEELEAVLVELFNLAEASGVKLDIERCYFCGGPVTVEDEHYIRCAECKNEYTNLIIHDGCGHLNVDCPTLLSGNVTNGKPFVDQRDEEVSVCSVCGKEVLADGW